ncbi:MAG: hypothetical protein F4070_00280, partial [Acidimicrobiales bacterium]|nr:hypothetical protein [Acidimicrobiales bacterium]
MAVGAYHGCALGTDGTIACWGDNALSQTGSPAGTFTAIVAGDDHTCALSDDGSVACWG